MKRASDGIPQGSEPFALIPCVWQLQMSAKPMAGGWIQESNLGLLNGLAKAGNTNANATGGERQICYKLSQGEAGWILRPTSVLNF